MKKNILLAGASGFMGQQIAAELIQSGYRVLTPVREQSIEKTASLQQYKDFIVFAGNFYDTKVLDLIKNESIEAILHFASIRGAGNGSAAEYEKINVTGTQILLDFALQNKIPNILYCSTVGVFGTIPLKQPADNSTSVNTDNLYHQTKWQAEEIVRQYSLKGLHTLILRPTITYGSGDDGFIPKLIQLIRHGHFPLSSKPFSIHLLHVQALSRLVMKILEENNFNNKTYIIADKKPLLFQELVKHISRETKGGYYAVPSAVFSLGRGLLSLLSVKGLHTSVQLISAPWTYDISETITDLDYVPDDTIVSVSKYIKEYM